MQAKNSITQSTQSKPGFTATISGAAVQKMINTALQDPRRAASFTSIQTKNFRSANLQALYLRRCVEKE